MPTKPKNSSIIEREDKHTLRSKGPRNCHQYKKEMLFVYDLKETKDLEENCCRTFALIKSGREMCENTAETDDI